jgi:DNA-binding NtrC family response regulator
MTKIAIFENEFKNLKASFEAVNLLHFNNELDYSHFQTSQAFGDLSRISEYKLSIIDIDLTAKSNMDGYQIIENILRISNESKIIILTGHIDITQQLKDRGLPNLAIITKPITHESIKKALIAIL